ncbi:MAG: ribosomal protein S18-alanine N-acetyltransferase [Lachnospiraceae bacterium]|nr:ribosomal protein S18-alanine N-acetyltransferase [Lachnospiraceae bacterium]
MSILIRKAKESDSEQICKLEQKIFSKNSSLEEIKRQIAFEDVYYFVAVIEKKIIGYLSAKAVLDEVDLWYIAVEPSYRNQGIGSRLMTEFMNLINLNGMQKITLEVRRSNQSAIHLYEKNKFKEISIRKDYYRNPIEDAVILQYAKNEDEM